MTARTRAAATVVFLVLVTLAVRLPFLLRGDRFFSADEAVEGLMARHVLQGEFPLFFWGQAYKGVPEVYAAAGVFAVAGSSVLALQAVTAVVFAAFVAVQFVLISRVFTAPIAWLASLFTIIAPPSLVYWSLVGVAEMSFTLLAGAVALLAVDRWRRIGSRRALALFAFAMGFGLWVQQYMFYYLAALAAAAWLEVPAARRWLHDVLSGSGVPRGALVVSRVLLAAGALYALLGLHAFFTGGFSARWFGVALQTTHPQKLWQIAGVIVVAAIGVLWWSRHSRTRDRFTRDVAMTTAAFLAGFSPFIAGRLRGGGVRAPLHSVQAPEMWAAIRRTATELMPILFGFRGPGVEPLGVPAVAALVIVAVAAMSYAGLRRSRETAFFHLFPLVVAVMFLASGAFVDAQSWRYLMPVYAAVPLILAVGVREAWRRARLVGVIAAVALTGLFAVQELRWYRMLVPDLRLSRALECVRQSGARYARADYWTSYRVTFLTNEQVIVASTDPDRYPPYTALVAADPSAPNVTLPASPDSPCDTVVTRPSP